MKIQYEVGDRVFTLDDYGNTSKEIVKVHKQGITFVNIHGERTYRTYKEIKATPNTLAYAGVIIGEVL